MLYLIKSSYFPKIIFSFIDDGTKLNLIKYNKKLQKIIDINILNYKLFSGKYIKYETKEKVKIYNTYNDNLIYEGEYINGKKMEKEKNFI